VTKRIEFTIFDQEGEFLQKPGFVEDCSQLSMAIKQAVDDFLESRGGAVRLPITINITPTTDGPTC